MFQEYPKMLYKGESYRIVADAAEEAVARADDWYNFGAAPPATPAEGGEKQAAPEPVKRGRKPVQQTAEGGEKQE